MKRTLFLSFCGLIGTALLGYAVTVSGAAEDVDKAALARTRKTVRMLDDIYKQTIVLITTKYVTKDSDYPAGRAAVKLFEAISNNGHHNVRLLDATGKPYNPKNVAKDEFEKTGIMKLKAGESYIDEVVQKDGKPYLRAMTTVPVVMAKCVECHAHYAAAKKGEAIGAISYVVPIE